jgi:ABC-type multidrug transport system, ATPase component
VSVIEVRGLRKEYRRLRGGKTVALSGLDLDVPAGGVYGFLGPNGSGKTTTVRCLLGLVRPSGGEMRLLGVDPRSDLRKVIARVGAIVETPAMFPGFSARRNLEILARIEDIDKARIDEVLETVDLRDRAKDRVKNYSLGMKQRLGIAAALLKDPELLILDEPANGLDPAGIKEVRELLRRLGGEGKTVFISSHILSEVRQTCDHVAILARGRCVAEGAVADVLSSGRTAGITARVDDLPAALTTLEGSGIEARVEDDALKVALPPTEGARVTKVLADAGLYVSELRPDEVDLETVFLELTGEPGS